MIARKDIPLAVVLAAIVITIVALVISVTSQSRDRSPSPTSIVVGVTFSVAPTALPKIDTATPIAAPSATPTSVPSPTPVPSFGPITFGTGISGAQALDAGHTFPPGTHQVYAVWSFRDMTGGTPYHLSWYVDDTLWSEERSVWDVTRLGSEGEAYVAHISEYDSDGLPPGNYRIELSIGERQAQVATFVIQAATPTPVPPTPTPVPNIQAAGRQAVRSLVRIWVPSELPLVSSRGGSGSIVDGSQGLILTNWHILSDRLGRLLNDQGYAAISLISDPESSPVFTYWARLLPEYSDQSLDLAILKIVLWGHDQTPVSRPLNLPAVPLGDSTSIRRGDHVLLLGFPDFAEGDLSWTEGVIVTQDRSWIKSDAGISHGHSGGMMLNERAALIGVPTQYERTSAGGVLAVARPINLARSLLSGASMAGPPSSSIVPSLGDAAPGDRMVVLVAEQLNLRAEPSLDGQTLGTLVRGAIVRVLEQPRWDGERLWYKVQVQGDNRVGWASGRYLASWETAQTPILFNSNREGSYDLYRVRPDGSELRRLTDDPGDEGDASWSPDRKWIAFTSDRSGNADLYIVPSEGGIWYQVTNDPADELHPVWSPDGTRLAFVSDRDGDWEIYVINTDGTGMRQLTFNEDWDSYPAWSPNGVHLAFTSRHSGNYDLYLVNVGTGELQRLTTSPYTDAHPSWSPNGQEIAYTMVVAQGSTLRREIGILDLGDPSHPRRTPFSQGDKALYSYPDWSPDGRWIVFTSEGDGNQDICLAPASGELVVNLTNAPFSTDFAPAWIR